MKNKYLTFSYDDGVVQDRRLVALLDKCDLKATFNLSSGWLGKTHHFPWKGKNFVHQKVEREEVPTLYRNHEVAAHTLTHPKLTSLSDEEIILQVEEDRKALSSLVGYEVVGMAYPGGTNNSVQKRSSKSKRASATAARWTVLTLLICRRICMPFVRQSTIWIPKFGICAADLWS